MVNLIVRHNIILVWSSKEYFSLYNKMLCRKCNPSNKPTPPTLSNSLTVNPKILYMLLYAQVCLLSQSWDSVASMHDHLLTVHSSCTNSILPEQDCPLVPCVCADGSGCRDHTPWQNKQVCYGNVLALLPTTDRYEQTSPLASLEAQWLAPAPA